MIDLRESVQGLFLDAQDKIYDLLQRRAIRRTFRHWEAYRFYCAREKHEAEERRKVRFASQPPCPNCGQPNLRNLAKVSGRCGRFYEHCSDACRKQWSRKRAKERRLSDGPNGIDAGTTSVPKWARDLGTNLE